MSVLAIEQLGHDRLDELAAVDGVVFHYTPTGSDRDDFWARMLEPGRTWAAVDAGSVVGTAASYSLRSTVPGGRDVAAAGVATVGVLPTHRRRGIMGRLLAGLLADARERGELVALLCPTEGTIYGRFGFGPAVLRAQLEIRAPRGLDLRVRPAERRLQLLDRDAALARLPAIYERVRPQRAGMLVRTQTWWDAHTLRRAGVLKGVPVPTSRVVAAGDDGYAVYSVGGSDSARERRTVEVRELVADGAATAAALLAYLTGIDLTDRVVLHNRPAGDDLDLVAADPTAIRVTAVSAAQWLRFIDVAGALAARVWGADVDLVIELEDADQLVAGRWHVRASGDACEVTATDRPADLRMEARDLASVYLGAVRVVALHRAGLATELRGGAIASLDAALRRDLAPWTLDPF